MQFPVKLVLLAMLGVSWAGGDEVPVRSSSFDKTLGVLGADFKGFMISRKLTSDPKISAFVYEFGPQGMESDSKQNLLGVGILVDDQGVIRRVVPRVAGGVLPDQKEVNKSISDGEGISAFIAKNDIDELSGTQLYGLISKWAVAILARKKGVKIVFDLNPDQVKKMEVLFNNSIKIPDLAGDRVNDEIVEDFAKAIIHFSPY